MRGWWGMEESVPAARGGNGGGRRSGRGHFCSDTGRTWKSPSVRLGREGIGKEGEDSTCSYGGAWKSLSLQLGGGKHSREGAVPLGWVRGTQPGLGGGWEGPAMPCPCSAWRWESHPCPPPPPQLCVCTTTPLVTLAGSRLPGPSSVAVPGDELQREGLQNQSPV